MARKPRVWYSGAQYHIYNRGNRRETLFYDAQDFFKYLTFLKETIDEYPCQIFSYCLMTNHIHIQLKTEEHPPGKIMGVAHARYAHYFNKKYKLEGHVFKGRFNGELIQFPDYELEVNRYIHLNPLKANMVTNLEDYPWSSYHAYANNKYDPLIDDTSHFLSLFAQPQNKNYKDFLLSTMKPHEVLQFLVK